MRLIIAGADGSVAGQRAEEWAARKAKDLGLRLNLVRVVPGPWAFRRPSEYRDAMARARDLLDTEAARVSSLVPSVELMTTRRTGETAQVLRLLSDTAEMVVVGSDRHPDSHGEGFGSVSFQAAVLSRCPVAVIPVDRPGDAAGVVAGVDGSADSAVALALAGAEAARMGEELTVVYAEPEPDPDPSGHGQEAAVDDHASAQHGRMLLSAAADAVRHAGPELVVHEVLDSIDSPAEALIRAAAHARLLVIGCRGRGGLRKPVGAVAEKVLLNLPCPTIITRPVTLRAPSSSDGAARTGAA